MLTKSFYTSSVGKKVLMAISGLALVGFIAGHLAGNLFIFGGPDALNAYGEKLRKMMPLLWVARVGLLTMVSIHIFTAVTLVLENRKARPRGYECKTTIETTIAARSMAFTGAALIFFIIYHLLHFTFKLTHPDLSHATDAFGHHDIYSMVVLSFHNPLLVAAYVLGVAALSMHLSHGIGSLAQSLGLNSEKSIFLLRYAGRAMGILIFLGYGSIPIACLLRLVPTPGLSL